MIKIKNIFNTTDKAIFKTFSEMYPNILDKYKLDVSVLDFDFLFEYGQKNINNCVYDLLNENFEISTENLQNICKILYNHYSIKWSNLLNVDNKQYDILNTDSYERINNNITQQNSKIINNQTNEESVNNNIYGFNSVGSVPQSESYGNQQTSSTKSSDLIDNTKNNDMKEQFVGRRGYAPQDLIEKERKKLNFDTLQTIFKDVCAIISLSIY